MVPAAIAIGVLVYLERPHLGGPWLALDLLLGLVLVTIGLQLVPLPSSVRLVISPLNVALVALEQLLQPTPSVPPDSVPLSMDPQGTATALFIAIQLVAVFWCARSIFHRGHLRTTIRAVAWMGLAVSAAAMLLHTVAPGTIYGYFHPLQKGAQTYGPFVNRNDFATWVVLALPTVVGYAMTRVQARLRTDGAPIDIESAVDDTFLWLGGSICLMAAALVLSVSRSGLIGTSAGIVSFVVITRSRARGASRSWLLVALGVVAIFALSYGNVDRLAVRFTESVDAGVAQRRTIWELTISLLRDFPLTGIGAGAFEQTMRLYQPAPHLFFYNHAHDEYLQLATEGGLLVGVPLALALVTGAWLSIKRMVKEDGAVAWTRGGALGGLIGVAVQNVWDTGLRMPANGVLFAVVCAVAMHHSHGRHRHGSKHREPWSWSGRPNPLGEPADDAVDVGQR